VPRRTRVDVELVRRGLARSRQQAAELIGAGKVSIDGMPAVKPGTAVAATAALKAVPHLDTVVGKIVEFGYERALRRGGVGGEIRQTHASAEDHHPALLEMATCAQRYIGFGDLTHRDRSLHAGGYAFFLQKVLQCKAVHDSAEHAHVVGAGPLHATLLQLRAPEEVSAADHNGDLGAAADYLGDLPGDQVDDVGVESDLPAAEHLATKLEHHPSIQRSRRRRWFAVELRHHPS